MSSEALLEFMDAQIEQLEQDYNYSLFLKSLEEDGYDQRDTVEPRMEPNCEEPRENYADFHPIYF